MQKMIIWLEKKHIILREIVGNHSRVIEIAECPFASLKTRPN